jgi:hypothetical protein
MVGRINFVCVLCYNYGRRNTRWYRSYSFSKSTESQRYTKSFTLYVTERRHNIRYRNFKIDLQSYLQVVRYTDRKEIRAI